MAQVWYQPATMLVAAGRVTGVGTQRLVVEPSPSCPLLLSPQHCTAPERWTAQVCWTPAAIAITSERRSEVGGESRSVVVPSPSCPFPLAPQQRMPPLEKSAQVCPPPTTSCVTPRKPGSLQLTL